MARTFNTGEVGTVHRGEWSATVAYKFLNTVYSTDGTLYLNTFTGATPVGTSLTDTNYWKIYLPGADLDSLNADITSVGDRVTALETVPSSIIQPTPDAGIVYTGSEFGYQKGSNGLVVVNLRFTSLTTTSTVTNLLTLPAGYRPARTIFSIWASGNTPVAGQIWSVTTAGLVRFNTPTIGTYSTPSGQIIYYAAS